MYKESKILFFDRYFVEAKIARLFVYLFFNLMYREDKLRINTYMIFLKKDNHNDIRGKGGVLMG